MADDLPLIAEPRKKYFYHEHASKLLKELNETRHLNHLCDGKVTFGERTVPVQKSILSSSSPYFRALFDYDSQLPIDQKGDARTSGQNRSVVSLDSMDISEETFSGILDFIYTAEVELSASNVQNMLQASDQLLMTDLKRLCCEYLDTCITIQNCIGIFDFTSQLSCTWSHFKVSQFLDANFSEVSQHGEFMELPASRVETFLKRQTINTRSEDEVVEVITRWFGVKSEARREDAINLLKSVVFAKQISDDCLKKLREFGVVGEEFFNILVSARSSQADTEVVQRGYSRVLVAVGGEGEAKDEEDVEVKAYTNCVRLSDTSAVTQNPQCWVGLAPMNTARVDHGLVEVAGCLYVAGGRDDSSQILNSCEKYDPKTNTWSPMAPMAHARKGFGLVVIENFIYAIGGSNDLTDPLTSMEVFDLLTNKWKPQPDMIVKKAFACCTATGKKIFVIGGGVVEKYYDSVEVFDTEFQRWYAVSPLRERRCFAQAACVNSDIYIFGGMRRIECPSAAHSGNNLKLCRSEFYNHRLDSWKPMNPYRYEHGYCFVAEGTSVNSVVHEGDLLLIVGELNMEQEWHSVRALNRHTLKWECMVASGPYRQRRFPSVALDIPAHVFRQLLWDQGKLRVTDILKTEIIETCNTSQLNSPP